MVKQTKQLERKQVIRESQWVYKMDPNLKERVQRKGEIIDGFGFSHGPSVSIWKSMLKSTKPNRYIGRMNTALDLFDIPKGAKVVADVGCGPWAGVFYVHKWETMYAIDPSWTMYESQNVVSMPCKHIKIIEDYAQLFKLPEKADLIFSINALNHGGDIQKSIDNIMLNLRDGGLFFLHLHLRNSTETDSGHPMALSEPEIRDLIGNYNVLKCNFLSTDPVKTHGGHPSVVATLRNRSNE